MTQDNIPFRPTVITAPDPVFESDLHFLAWWREEERRVRQQAEST